MSFERLCPLLDNVGLGQRLHHYATLHRLAASLPTKGTLLRSPAALCGGSSYDIYGTVMPQIALKTKRHNAIARFIGHCCREICTIAMANLTGKLPVSLGSCLQRSCVHRCVSAHPHTLRQPARTPHRGVHTVVAAAGKELVAELF